jgi:hypothetical protein
VRRKYIIGVGDFWYATSARNNEFNATSLNTTTSLSIYPFGLVLSRNFSLLTTHSRGGNQPLDKHHSSWLFRRIYTPTPGIEPSTLKFFGPEPRTLNNWVHHINACIGILESHWLNRVSGYRVYMIPSRL